MRICHRSHRRITTSEKDLENLLQLQLRYRDIRWDQYGSTSWLSFDSTSWRITVPAEFTVILSTCPSNRYRYAINTGAAHSWPKYTVFLVWRVVSKTQRVTWHLRRPLPLRNDSCPVHLNLAHTRIQQQSSSWVQGSLNLGFRKWILFWFPWVSRLFLQHGSCGSASGLQHQQKRWPSSKHTVCDDWTSILRSETTCLCCLHQSKLENHQNHWIPMKFPAFSRKTPVVQWQSSHLRHRLSIHVTSSNAIAKVFHSQVFIDSWRLSPVQSCEVWKTWQ